MMYAEHGKSAGETTSQERRAADQDEERVLGHVVFCDGARALISAYAGNAYWTVGKMVSINLGATRTVALVYSIAKADHVWDRSGDNPIEVSVELIGEVRDTGPDQIPLFDRGIATYPAIGAIAHRIRAADLKAVYDLGNRHGIAVGHLSQDEAIEAGVAIDDTLARHFAFVGTTGVGKSTAVSLLVRKAVEARPDLRILILDPHNEFADVLADHAVRLDTRTLDLPFWLFRLEELAEVLLRGREPVPDEIEMLRDLIPAAKSAYRSPASPLVLKRGGEVFTADTPVPYRMADLIRMIDERIGSLDAKHERGTLKGLRGRLESAIADPRYHFMFASRMVEDTIHETIGRIFRIPHEGRRITCFEMAGLPSEVVNSVCSVLARLAFDLTTWSDNKLKLLLLCEEAHRYLPADPQLGFAPTRHALARIAKEGRKYGCYLGVVTQRPAELDPTILSQCSTVFAMRLANEADQAIIRSAITGTSKSSLAFLSAMGQREAIAFGEGVATTMRLKFEKLAPERVPGRKNRASAPSAAINEEINLAGIVDRLRSVSRGAQRMTAPQPTASMSSQETESCTASARLDHAGESRAGFQKPGAFGRFQRD